MFKYQSSKLNEIYDYENSPKYLYVNGEIEIIYRKVNANNYFLLKFFWIKFIYDINLDLKHGYHMAQ